MITDSYDIETEPLITPEHFYGEKRCLVKTCLILFSHELHSYLLSHYACKQLAVILSCREDITIWCLEHKGTQIAFYLSITGSSGASELCSEVHWLIGADTFYMFGSCGTLDAEKKAGRFIIPTSAYRCEGASYYYAPAADYITVRSSDALAERFAQRDIPYVQGRVWTTDSMLRETRGLVAKRRAEGCIAVEMELAGVQAVCDFYALTLFCFLEAGDILAENSYEYDGLQAANHNLTKLLIALDFASES